MGAKAKSASGSRRRKGASKRAAKPSADAQHRYYPDSIPPGMAHEVFDVSRIDEDGLEVLDDDEVEQDPSEPPPPRSSLRPSSVAPHPPRPSVRPRPLAPDDLRLDTPLSYAGSPTALPVARAPETTAAPAASSSAGRTFGLLAAAALFALLLGMAVGRRGGDASLASRAEARPATTPVVEGDGRFSRARAEHAIATAVARAGACRTPDAPGGALVARVTYAHTGQVVGVDVSGPLAKTGAGACFEAALRDARVPAFEGGVQSVEHTVEVP